MSRRRHVPLFLLCGVAALMLLPRVCRADATDPAAARELLKQGYTLKQNGKYAEALERLLESLRLDGQPKTLMNVADCEEHLGQFSKAQKHWVLARDQASLQGNQVISTEAEKRLAALEARMPRLTVNPTLPAVAGISIAKDGVLLSDVSLGVPLPSDPGHHEVLVTAPGHADRRYGVDLVERDSKVLDVAAGPTLDASVRPATGGDTAKPLVAPVRDPRAETSGGGLGVQRWIGIGAGGAGVAMMVAGTVVFLQGNSRYDDAVASCTLGPSGTECPAAQRTSIYSEADVASKQKGTGTVLLGVGGALLVGGVVVYFTAPSKSGAMTSSTARVRMQLGAGSVALSGPF